MTTFKEGDWVRCVDNTLATGLLKLGAVYRVRKANSIYVYVDENPTGGMSHRRFEPWTPKVGERVTTNGNTSVNIEEHWNRCFSRGNGCITGGALVVASVENGVRSNVGLSNKVGQAYFYMPSNTLQPAEPLPVAAEAQPAAQAAPAAPAQLTIQAGKFYKTRDGRKVGPMKKTDLGDYRDDSRSVTSQCWSKVGTFIEGCVSNLDLIAEWPADATNVAATVDALDEEYGPVVAVADVPVAKPKFKVGDRVLVTCNKTNGGYPIDEYIIGKVYNVTAIVADLNGNDAALLNGHSQYLKRNQFTLVESAIVCLIDNSHPLPATRPRLHDSVEAADKEAARLAGVHRGQEFGVFAMTGAPHKVEKTYEHEWQRLAANGETAQARQKLQDISGLTGADSSTCIQRFVAKLAA